MAYDPWQNEPTELVATPRNNILGDYDPEEYTRHVSEVLALLLRPQWALAGAWKRGVQQGEGLSGAASGLVEGLQGKETSPAYDLIGLQRPQETDEWLPWLGKAGMGLLVDAVADPMLGLGKLGKLARLSQPYQKASEWAHGTGTSRWLAKGIPAHRLEDIGLPNQEVQRIRAESVMPATETYSRAAELAGKELGGLSPEEYLALRHNWERKLDTGVSPELNAAWEELHGRSNQSLGELNEIAQRLGVEGITPRFESDVTRYTPKILTEEAEQAAARSRGYSPYTIQGPEKIAHREVQTLVDPLALQEGRAEPRLTAEGRQVVSKPLEKYGFEQTKEGDWLYKKGDETLRGAMIDATLKEMTEAGMTGKREFVPDIGASYLSNIQKLENQKAFLNFIEKGLAGKAAGPIQKGVIAEGAWLKKVKDPAELPKDWRQLRLPGFTEYAAPKWAANFIESRGRTLYDANWFPGKVEEAADALINRTKLGQTLKKGTGMFKKSVLALFPGYYAGNIASNTFLQYASGMRPDQWAKHTINAAMVQAGKGEPLFANMTNAQLQKEMATRGMGDWATMGMDVAPDVLGPVVNKTSTRKAAEKLPEGVLRKAGEGFASAWEAGGRAQTKVLKTAGGLPETNAKMAVALDWLEKQGIKTPTATDLDRAAMYAKDAMIDYEGIMASPTARLMGQAVPFWAWQKGITSKTLEQLMTHPERLGRVERTLDTIFDTPTEEQERVMDPWMLEQSPTFGAFGHRYGEDEQGNPNMFMVGRYQPWGAIEAMTSRPMDYAASIANPLVKGPIELMMNKSSFKDKPIDEIAGSFPANIINPQTHATTKPFGLDIPASAEYALSQAPGGRMIGAVSEMGRSAGLWADPYKSEADPSDFFEWYLSGGKTFPFDYAKSMARKQRAADAKGYAIKSKLRLASMKGDESNVLFYQQELQKHQRDSARALGFVGGDEEYEED